MPHDCLVNGCGVKLTHFVTLYYVLIYAKITIMVNLKKLLIASALLIIFSSTQTYAANPGDSITAINFGEYATFGGSTWRKARYYDHDNFVSDEQGYFIRLYDDSYTSIYFSLYLDPNANRFSTSFLSTSTLPTFYTNMTNTNNIKDAVLDANWSTGASTYVNDLTPGTLASTSYYTSKVAIPSTWEVANNSEIFSTANANYFWLRTPRALSSSGAWYAMSSSYFKYVNVNNTRRVVPGLRLSSTTTIFSGDGTSDNPYVLGYSPYMINIENGNADITPTKSSPNFTIAGTIDYPEDGDATSVEVSATIGGVNRSVNIPVSTNMTWQLSWSYNELNEGEYTNLEFTATSNSSTPEETTSTYTGTIIIDKTPPTCGSWSPAESAWKISGAASFTLTSSTDVGGSNLATESASLTCSTGPVHGDTCQATIFDNAGNTTICTSPNNRVDIYPPNLSVTPAIIGWQGDKQDIIVTSNDEQTSLSRIAYAWDINTLGADCTGGTTLTSGDNIRLTIAGGANPLFVCSSDIAGNVTSFTDIYSYTPPVFANPKVDKNVKPSNLYWNIQSVSETQSYIEVKGFFPKTTGSYNYALEYIIPTINKSFTQAFRTSPFTETHFTFLIPTTDFRASKDNHTFSGPQKLKITDLDQMEATTIDHNLSFFFPIHQSNHRTSFNYFILASDNRLNEVVTELGPDITPPFEPIFTPDALVVDHPSTITVNLLATDQESGISHYEYCVTTDGSVCAPNLIGSAITLSTINNFRICAKAIDNSGNMSETVCSNVNAYRITNLQSTMQGWTGCSALITPTGTSFTQGPILTDERDGKQYEIRKFADGKCWMVNNLMYGGETDICAGKSTFASNGSATASNRFGTGTFGDCRDPRVGGVAPCTAGSTTCGYYYNWQAAMQHSTAWYDTVYTGPTTNVQGLCPDGWRLPRGGSGGDFNNLYTVVGYSMTGFFQPIRSWKGIYAGYYSGGLAGQGNSGYWWASTFSSNIAANNLAVSSTYVVPADINSKTLGFSIRCLKN